MSRQEDDATKVKPWELLGKGSFNQVFVSPPDLRRRYVSGFAYEGRWVLKLPIPDEDDGTILGVNQPLRAVCVWNEINPDLPAVTAREGWVAPFIQGDQAEDAETAAEVIKIYKKTKRIVVDACGWRNFIKSEAGVICVDVGGALRRGSIASDQYWNESTKKKYESYWDSYQRCLPVTVITIRTLVYLQDYLSPEGISDEHLDYTLKLLNLLHQRKTVEITCNVIQTICYHLESQKNIRESIGILIRFLIKKVGEEGQRAQNAVEGAESILVMLAKKLIGEEIQIDEELLRYGKDAMAMKEKSLLRKAAEFVRKPLYLFGIFSSENNGRFGGYRTSGGRALAEIRKRLLDDHHIAITL